MPRERDPIRREMLTQATVLQVRAGLLRRRVHRRGDLPDGAQAWLDEELALLVQTARELAILVGGDGVAAPAAPITDVPTARLMAVDTTSRN